MRVKYEVDKDKMVMFLNYVYASNNPIIDEFFVVVFGYIIDRDLTNYPFDALRDLCKGKIHHKNPVVPVVGELSKSYLGLPLDVPLTNKSTRWVKVGIDFMLTNCKKYIPIGVLKNKNAYKKENKAIREYIIDNKEEFPDVYLELVL